MTDYRLLVCWLLLVGFAWGQSPTPTPGGLETPTASPTASATPGPTPAHDPHEGHDHTEVHNHEGRDDLQEPYKPSAQETDKPAVFGYMILARQELMVGTPTWKVLRQSLGPWLISAFLLPIYWFLARRRGFRF